MTPADPKHGGCADNGQRLEEPRIPRTIPTPTGPGSDPDCRSVANRGQRRVHFLRIKRDRSHERRP